MPAGLLRTHVVQPNAHHLCSSCCHQDAAALLLQQQVAPVLLNGTPASAVFSSHMHGYLQDAHLHVQSCKETAQPSFIHLHEQILWLYYKLDIKPEHRLCNYSGTLPHKRGLYTHATALQKVYAHGRVCLVLHASQLQKHVRKSAWLFVPLAQHILN